MSYLSKEYRLNKSKDFNILYKSGKKWHTHSFVAFFMPDEKYSFAFVASKKVGNAVKRSKAKARLRAMILAYDDKIKSGKYIFIVKSNIFDKNVTELKSAFNFAFKRLELFKK